MADGPFDEERGDGALNVRQRADPADDQRDRQHPRAGDLAHLVELAETHRRERDDRHVHAVAEGPAAVPQRVVAERGSALVVGLGGGGILWPGSTDAGQRYSGVPNTTMNSNASSEGGGNERGISSCE